MSQLKHSSEIELQRNKSKKNNMFSLGVDLPYLLCLSSFIAETLNNVGQIDVIYTKFSKEFDRLDHGILLKKLRYN